MRDVSGYWGFEANRDLAPEIFAFPWEVIVTLGHQYSYETKQRI
jgi:hypothetical protein